MIERKHLTKPNKLTREYIERCWNNLLLNDMCFKCNGALEFDGSLEIVRCIMCGKRYYKNYPERTSEYEFCIVCKMFFKRYGKNDITICKDCRRKYTVTRTSYGLIVKLKKVKKKEQTVKPYKKRKTTVKKEEVRIL